MVKPIRTNICLLITAGAILLSVSAGCSNKNNPNTKSDAAQVKAFMGDPNRMPQSEKDRIAKQQADAMKNIEAVRNADAAKAAPHH